MSKFMNYLALGLLSATATAASAAPVCSCGNAATAAPAPAPAPAPATAAAPAVRRYSYQPGLMPAPVYRNYWHAQPATPRYLLPKIDARRFST